jgi:hypothetical protein
MADIGIKISSNIKRESVLINPNVTPADRVIREQDENGKLVYKGVNQINNILARGNSAKQVASQIYGK